MKTIKSGYSSFVFEFSREELGLVSNALNEVCNGIDVPEFQTRLGVSVDIAQRLLAAIAEELKKPLS